MFMNTSVLCPLAIANLPIVVHNVVSHILDIPYSACFLIPFYQYTNKFELPRLPALNESPSFPLGLYPVHCRLSNPYHVFP